MVAVTTSLAALSAYKDQKYPGTEDDFLKEVTQSTTVYVGNLSFYTTEEQIYELFSRAGEIKRIIMGLDRLQKTPCGFCFVEYYTRQDSEDCMKYVNGSKLDDRVIRTDWDPGFREGRQYGRGRSGGQVRDEYRLEFDAGRGGWGHEKRREVVELTEDVISGPASFSSSNKLVEEVSHVDQKRGFEDEQGKQRAKSTGKRGRDVVSSSGKRTNDDDSDDDDNVAIGSGFGAMNQIDEPIKRSKRT